MSILWAVKRLFAKRWNTEQLTASPKNVSSLKSHQNHILLYQLWQTCDRPEVRSHKTLVSIFLSPVIHKERQERIIENFHHLPKGMTSPSDQYPPPQMFDPHMGPIPAYQYPPPPPQATNYPSHSMPSTSSAFYPPQQVHRDPMGESLELYLLTRCFRFPWNGRI